MGGRAARIRRRLERLDGAIESGLAARRVLAASRVRLRGLGGCAPVAPVSGERYRSVNGEVEALHCSPRKRQLGRPANAREDYSEHWRP